MQLDLDEENLQLEKPVNALNKGDENFCSTSAIFGVLIALTGLMQLFVYANYHWVTMVLMTLYSFSVISYVSLGLQKSFSVYLIYCNIVITLIIYGFYVVSGIWSLIVIILCVYNAVIASIAFVEDLLQKLRSKAKLLQDEKRYWQGKL